MKSLLVLRHAKSSWKDANQADHDRSLNDRGKRDAPRIGRLIADQGLHPDLILSSTAKRARSTAKRVIEGGGFSCSKQLLDEFYLAPPETYIDTLQQLPNEIERVLIIGHNPGLEALVGFLTGEHETLPTAALVQIEFEFDAWDELGDQPNGKQMGIWRPREMA
jgi:phosphohistidine phosphatase